MPPSSNFLLSLRELLRHFGTSSIVFYLPISLTEPLVRFIQYSFNITHHLIGNSGALVAEFHSLSKQCTMEVLMIDSRQNLRYLLSFTSSNAQRTTIHPDPPQFYHYFVAQGRLENNISTILFDCTSGSGNCKIFPCYYPNLE